MDKFVVHEMSMSPALMPGDRLLTTGRPPTVGEIAVFPQPNDPTRWLVKRVAAGPGSDVSLVGSRLEISVHGQAGVVVAIPPEHRSRDWSLADDEMFVLSDALHETRADSRFFGPVSLAGARTAVLRYRPLRRLGRL
jgi:signal peptidase I